MIMDMNSASRRQQGGFTLLEVMITAVILIGALMAISGLQTTASNVEYDAYQRSRAAVLAEDMVARMNANRKNAVTYVTGTSKYWGTGDSQPANCSGSGLDRDNCEWSNLLKGTAVSADGTAQPGLKNAIGCIVASSVAQEYFVVVAWQGQTPSNTAALKPSDCGKGIYSNDDYRRVLVRGMRVADLNNLVVPTPAPPTP